MAKRVNFTIAALNAATPPGGKRRGQLYDLRTPGLLFEVTQQGAQSFYLYRWVSGAPQRIRLGGFPEMSIEQARKAAARINGDIAKGIDPRSERQRVRASMTLAELFNHYLDTHAKTHNKTWEADRRQFDRYFGKPPAQREPDDDPPPFSTWRTRRVNTITEPDVKKGMKKDAAAAGEKAAEGAAEK